jgi:hypothetical protein
MLGKSRQGVGKGLGTEGKGKARGSGRGGLVCSAREPGEPGQDKG